MAGRTAARKIILCADGTGNSRRSQFRTNVWKLYDALDLTPGNSQIAYYHDGVGTDAFAPLKYLGAIFGYGLAANVQAIYKFLCRNYRPGDEIYIFGFSRGAFTARILAALISREGVKTTQDDADLDRWVAQAFRRFRRNNHDSQYGRIRRFFVKTWRMVYDWFAAKTETSTQRPEVTFLGCWDTVAAYGGPSVAMVRGWDYWVFPLSFANYGLDPQVQCARHALALDEERESFLPLLWDEYERTPGVKDQRIKQIWFPGVHSDVGGGYPDQQLSDVPLLWMMDEAIAQSGGSLRFHRAACAKFKRNASTLGPRHDSRSGIGITYRYQPRRIEAYTQPLPGHPIRDPNLGQGRILEKAIVHPSVITHCWGALDGYVPFALPPSFSDTTGKDYELNAAKQREIWSQVHNKRLRQFSILTIGILMILLPILRPISEKVNHYFPLSSHTPPVGWKVLFTPLYWMLNALHAIPNFLYRFLKPDMRHLFEVTGFLDSKLNFLNKFFQPATEFLLGITIPGLPDWLARQYYTVSGYLLVGVALIYTQIKISDRTSVRIRKLSRAVWVDRPPFLPPLPVSKWQKCQWWVRRWFRWDFAPNFLV